MEKNAKKSRDTCHFKQQTQGVLHIIFVLKILFVYGPDLKGIIVVLAIQLYPSASMLLLHSCQPFSTVYSKVG